MAGWSLPHGASPQFDVGLAAFAVFFLEHGDGADFAPVVDLVAAVFGDFENADDLDEGRGWIAADDQLDLHIAEALVAAEGAGANVFEQGNQVTVGGLERQDAIAGFGNGGNARLFFHGVGQIDDAAAEGFGGEGGRFVVGCGGGADEHEAERNKRTTQSVGEVRSHAERGNQ